MKFLSAARYMVAALLAVALLLPGFQAYADTKLADGTYTADYLVLKAEDDSVSMANDYWEKPATVMINSGKITIQLTVNHSMWVTEFKVPGGGGYIDTKVIETNKKDDKRRVEFTAASVTEPILSKIHVTVAEIDYDHDYTIRISFDMDSFKLVKAAEQPAQATATAKPAATEKPAATKAPAATAKPAEAGKSESAASATAKPAEATAKPTETASPSTAASEAAAPLNEETASASPDAAASEQPEETATAEQTEEAASGEQTGGGNDTTTGGAEVKTAASGAESGEAEQASDPAVAAKADEQTAAGSNAGWWIAAVGAVAALAAALIYNAKRRTAKRDNE